jgi:sugar lactone lactonase YvrE
MDMSFATSPSTCRARAAVALLLLAVPRWGMTDSWTSEYAAAVTRARAACAQPSPGPCRDSLRLASSLTDGRPDLACRLAGVEARMHHTAAARDDLEVCVASGLDSEEVMRAPETLGLPDHARLEALRRRLAVPSRGYSVAYSLTDPDLIAEDITYDPSRSSFLVSSVHERKIIRLDSGGGTTDLRPQVVKGWMGGIFGLALDAHRNVLWATTSAGASSPPYSAADDGRSAVLELDPQNGAVIGRLELADGKPHGFGDVALDRDGTLYVADGRGGGVYAIRPGLKPNLEPLVAPQSLISPQTPALLNGRRLLIPDYSRGIAELDLASRNLRWVSHPRELALFGIDGLYAHGRTLVAVQNGTVPERVLELTLDPACRSIERWRVLVARVPELGDPTHGIIIGDTLYFIANSGWDRVADGGEYGATRDARPAQIWKLTLPPAVACIK